MENDQAERLRKKAADRDIERISTLPSRSEVHGKKKETRKKKDNSEKKQKKSTFLLTRLLLLAFILLIGLTVTYQYWSEKVYLPVHSEDRKGVEQVKIER